MTLLPLIAYMTGAGYIMLAATLSILPTVPDADIASILRVVRILSECRSLTTFIRNAVGTIVLTRWCGASDRGKLHAALA